MNVGELIEALEDERRLFPSVVDMPVILSVEDDEGRTLRVEPSRAWVTQDARRGGQRAFELQ